jgi:hypothetical protein
MAGTELKPRKNPINNIPPDRRGNGRPPGLQNKMTRHVKDALCMAAELAGDDLRPADRMGMVSYFREMALKKPDLFMPLLGKVLPLQVQGAASDGALEIRWLPPEEPPKAIIDHDAEDV